MLLIMMIRTLLSNASIVILISVCFTGSAINAQWDNKSTSDLKTEALKNFDSGNYSDALEKFKGLLKRYPKEGIFSYYCGLSLLNMDKDIPGAIEFLEFSSSKAAVPGMVFYHLGDAYTRNYQFPQAKKAYDQFTAVASKSEQKGLIPERLSEMAENAIGLTSSYNQVEILSSSLFTFNDSGYVRQVKTPGGSLTFKPADFSPTSEGIQDLSNLMFIPRKAEKGELLFFAGYGKNKKRGTEIFLVKAGNGHNYSEPEAVEALNSEYDEIMPYYDPIAKDLIFASRGHNSMGGFDLFRSHYDNERNSWTPPINLGFPVNSPSDEFLMIPGTDMGIIMLITDRQGLDSMITAYMLRIHEPRVQLTNSDPAGLMKIGKFGGIEAIPEMPDMTIRDILADTVPAQTSGSIVPWVERPKPGGEGEKMPAGNNGFLRLALDQQFKADSLSGLARKMRIHVKNLPDPDERWTIQKNIISWEKEASGCQAKADEYYQLVKQMENESHQAIKIPDAITIDTVINDITVYKYKQAEAGTDTNEAKQQPVVAPKNPVTGEPSNPMKPGKDAEKVIYSFVVHDKSLYSAKNPFPENGNLPKGACYKIQLAVLGKNPDWNAFGGLSPVTAEQISGKPLKKYYAGKFTNYESAKTALEEVRKNGFPEAFIVGWYDGQKMSVSKVVELEKQ
jgi:tetratricopeptide (TPR) repeat protein